MIVLGISLACLAMFVYQLYVIVMRDKLLTTVQIQFGGKVKDRNESLTES